MISLVYANSSSMSSVKHKMIYIFNWFLIEMANCFHCSQCTSMHVCVCERVSVCGMVTELWP